MRGRMSLERIPQQQALLRRWQLERISSDAPRVFWGISLLVMLLVAALFFLPSPGRWLGAFLLAGGILWTVAVLFLLAWFFRKPSAAALAKRADRVLGFDDECLSLSEIASAHPKAGWGEAIQERTVAHLASLDLKQAWPIRWPRGAWLSGLAAVALTCGLGWLGWQISLREEVAAAREKAAQKERLAAADDVLRDWKDFARTTDDKELKKLFTEAANLREAIQNKDPMAAMLEMNRFEEKVAALQQQVDKESMAPQASRLAEALEAFEGMGAMSAALRNKDFANAATEAEKLAEQLNKDPNATSALRRDAAVAEMLSTESKNAASRGNQGLSSALSQMSEAATQAGQKGAVSNQQIAPPTKSLQNQFQQEAGRQNRNLALSLSKQQLDALRRRMRGEEQARSSLPSLCQSCCQKPGGHNAGHKPGGDPHGSQTALAAAGAQESVAGTAGEGESEKRTTSSTSGSGTTVASARPTSFSDYAELSRQAITDENLPLAYREVIRTYFERIRPVAEKNTP